MLGLCSQAKNQLGDAAAVNELTILPDNEGMMTTRLIPITEEETIMERKKSRVTLVLLAVGVYCGMFFFLTGPSEAQQKKATDLEGVAFNTGASLADNIKSFVGKDVVVHLRSGKSFQGYVKSVGNGLVHLEKLSGKDFYDALVRTEDISAIEAKFREMK
jgi:hypothetical protein